MGEVLLPGSASPPSPAQQVVPLGLKGPRLGDRQVLSQVPMSLPPVLLRLLFRTYIHLHTHAYPGISQVGVEGCSHSGGIQ